MPGKFSCHFTKITKKENHFPTPQKIKYIQECLNDNTFEESRSLGDTALQFYTQDLVVK